MFKPTKEDINVILDRTQSEFRKLSGSTVYLTGAAGFLGRYFLHVISQYNANADRKIKLIGVDNFISSGVFGQNLQIDQLEGLEFKKVDVSNLTQEDLDLARSANFVIHCAGIASPQHYKTNPLETIDVAINGSRKLLEACRTSGARYTFFSSSEIYGNPPAHEIPIKESFKGIVSSTGPRSCYDESKRLGETLCSVYQTEYEVHTNIIRPFNVYGPGMQSMDYRVMPNFAFRIKENLPLEVYGTGKQTRTYCYVTDAITGFLKIFCSGEPGQAYNIGNPNEEISALSLAEKFKESANKKVEILVKDHPPEYPSDEPDRRCPDISKAKQHLNYSPIVNLDSGIARFCEYVGM
jgi:UDP-glucuronate decarboxylase